MSATQIRPPATRDTFVQAVTAAEKLTTAAALTDDDELRQAAVSVQRQAWLALERFDAR